MNWDEYRRDEGGERGEEREPMEIREGPETPEPPELNEGPETPEPPEVREGPETPEPLEQNEVRGEGSYGRESGEQVTDEPGEKGQERCQEDETCERVDERNLGLEDSDRIEGKEDKKQEQTEKDRDEGGEHFFLNTPKKGREREKGERSLNEKVLTEKELPKERLPLKWL
nr:hypothetical protein [Candidatus Freyarchaeota archaeon]